MNAGSIESPVENDSPTQHSAEVEGATIWFRIHGLLERMQIMLSRRYQDPRAQDPDYVRRLRELEGQIAEIDREQRGFRIVNHEGGGGRETSWKDWILTIVGLLIVAWLARLDMKLEDMSELRAQQKLMEQRQDQTDKHLEATDSRVDRVEARVYRSSP